MAKLQLFKHPELIMRVPLKQLRAHLTELVAHAEHHNAKIILTRHGKRVAAIVSMKDYHRVWDAEEEELFGPRDAKGGKRPGGGWVRATGWKPARAAPKAGAKAGFWRRVMKRLKPRADG